MMHISKKIKTEMKKLPFNAGTDEADFSMDLRVINKLIKKGSMEQL